jgi:hypothetical protein
MKYYIVVKIFLVVYTTIGPFDTKDDCIKQMIQYRDEAMSRYAQGERINFLGAEVKPSKVSAQCKLK